MFLINQMKRKREKRSIDIIDEVCFGGKREFGGVAGGEGERDIEIYHLAKIKC